MRITHFGHACLLIESDSTRVLVDPGTYSGDFAQLRHLDAILVTHMHADHIDPRRFPALVQANPKARLLVEPEAAATHEVDPAAGFAAGDSTTVGSLQIRALGGTHAANHDAVPAVGNVGFVVRDGDDRNLFHPGDSYDETPDGIDVLCLPLNAPWCRMKETLSFLTAVSPRVAIPIHDALLSDNGRAAYLMHVEKFGPDATTVTALNTGQSYGA